MRRETTTRQGVRNLDLLGSPPSKPRRDLRQQVCGHLNAWHEELGAGRRSRTCDDCHMYEEYDTPQTEEVARNVRRKRSS